MVKKINIASCRVLLTLACLHQGGLTMPELISKLNSLGYGVYNNYTVTKYLHTLKTCGIDIQKIQNKYSIINFPFGIKFTPTDTKLLHKLSQKGETLQHKDISFTIAKFFDKIHLPYFRSDNGVKSRSDYNIIKHLEQAYKTSSEVFLTYHNETKETGFIKDIKVVDENYYFILASENGTKNINTKEIKSLKIIEKKEKSSDINRSVIFELYGKLAERYQLRSNEQIIKYKPNGSIVVVNEYEDSFVLMQRLLRYDSSCKVLAPENFVKQFSSVVNQALTNYNIDVKQDANKNHIQKTNKKRLNKKDE